MNPSETVKPSEKERPDILKPADVAKTLRKERPKLFGKVPDKKAAALIHAALAALGRYLGAKKEGVVKIPGLGNFRVRQVVREKAGQKRTVTRTLFRAAKRQGKGGRPASRKP